MKKLFYLCILILLMGLNAYTHDYYPLNTTKFKSKPIYRVQAGLNFSNVFERDDEEIYVENQTNTGFHLGITAEFPTSQKASFETGLILSTKGFKYKFQNYYGDTRDLELFEISGKENLIYLDIPLTAKFHFSQMDNSKFFGVFGSYVSIGIGGKEKSTITNLDTEEIEKDTDSITFGYSDQSWYNLFDFGMIAGVGIDMDTFQISLRYNFGLANISPDTEDGYKIKNRVMQISVAYKFDMAKILKSVTQ